MIRTPTKSSGKVAQRLNQAASSTTKERQILAAISIASVVNWSGAQRSAVCPFSLMTVFVTRPELTARKHPATANAPQPWTLTGLCVPRSAAEDDDRERRGKSRRRHIERDPDESFLGQEEEDEGLADDGCNYEQARRQKDEAEEERDLS